MLRNFKANILIYKLVKYLNQLLFVAHTFRETNYLKGDIANITRLACIKNPRNIRQLSEGCDENFK